QEGEVVVPRHLEIADHEVVVGGLDGRDRGRRIADGVDREPLAAQQVGGGLGEDGLVVGEEDASHRTHAWCSPGSGSSKGRVTTKRAPPSRASSTVIAPPAAVTLRATIERPSPMPLFSA